MYELFPKEGVTIATSKPESPSSSNFSALKLLKIIELMAQAKRPLRLQEIARAADMPQSTVSRFLSALVTAGYAMQNTETLKYQLTLRFCRIGDALRSQFNIRDICKPYLYTLAQKVNEPTFLYVEENMTVVCLDFADAPTHLTRSAVEKVGHTDSMHSTAAGKVLLLSYSKDTLDKFLSSRGLPKHTDKTIIDRPQFLAMLDQVRTEGFAVDDEENETGVRSIAAPILDDEGKVIASIGISGLASRLNYYEINRLKTFVLNSAAEISTVLGYRPSDIAY